MSFLSNKVYSPEQLSSDLGVDIPTVRRWARKGELPGGRFLGRKFFGCSKEEVDKFVRGNASQEESPPPALSVAPQTVVEQPPSPYALRIQAREKFLTAVFKELPVGEEIVLSKLEKSIRNYPTMYPRLSGMIQQADLRSDSVAKFLGKRMGSGAGFVRDGKTILRGVKKSAITWAIVDVSDIVPDSESFC